MGVVVEWILGVCVDASVIGIVSASPFMVSTERSEVSRSGLPLFAHRIQKLSHGIEVEFLSVRGKPFGELGDFGYVHITGTDVIVLRKVELRKSLNAGRADRGLGLVGAGVLRNDLSLANLISFQMPRTLCTLDQRQQLSLPQLVHLIRSVDALRAHDCIPLAQEVRRPYSLR
ncbi:hypothetical protein FQZ97_918510 [compost metagenome]